MIGQNRRRELSTHLLPWAPPSLSGSRRVVELTGDDADNRTIELDPGEDCEVRFLEPLGYLPGGFSTSQDAIVTVLGGRHVTAVGAHFSIDHHPETWLVSPAAADASRLVVVSTEGFPDRGVIRVGGEAIQYSVASDTAFLIEGRNVSYFNGAGVPPLAFTAGEKVYIGEYARGGLSFRNQAGFVHVEGARIEGSSLLDGVRIRGTQATTVSLQNTYIGPVGPSETVTMYDGHADCIQTWGSGVKLLRASHMSLLSGVNGRGLINAANTSGGGAVERIILQDTELLDVYGRRQSLVTNSDSGTSWTISNSWLRTNKVSSDAAPELHPYFLREGLRPLDRPWLDPLTLGVGYVSPGYAA